MASWCAGNNLHPLQLSSPLLANCFIELLRKTSCNTLLLRSMERPLRIYRLTEAVGAWPLILCSCRNCWRNFLWSAQSSAHYYQKGFWKLSWPSFNSVEFETLPQAGRRKILKKAAFLITMASAGRISEIQLIGCRRFLTLFRTAL